MQHNFELNNVFLESYMLCLEICLIMSKQNKTNKLDAVIMLNTRDKCLPLKNTLLNQL